MQIEVYTQLYLAGWPIQEAYLLSVWYAQQFVDGSKNL